MKRVIIAGGRDFIDYEQLYREADIFLKDKGKVVIINGVCPTGADRIARAYAKDRNLSIDLYEANWHEHGNAAGPIRNAEMANNADACLCFWDGVSKGTANMIKQAKKEQLELKVIIYKPK